MKLCCGVKPRLVGLLPDLYFVECGVCGKRGYESACVDGAIANWNLGAVSEVEKVTGYVKEIKQGISMAEYAELQKEPIDIARRMICDKYIPQCKKHMWYGCRFEVKGNEVFVYHTVAEEWEE